MEYAELIPIRVANILSLPPEITREQLEQLEQSNSTGASSTGAAAAKDLASGGSATNGSSYQALLNKLDTFAPVVFGLLGAIFVVLLGLLGVGIALCIRRGRTVGVARTANPGVYSPVPVRFKEPEPEYRDEENRRYDQ